MHDIEDCCSFLYIFYRYSNIQFVQRFSSLNNYHSKCRMNQKIFPGRKEGFKRNNPQQRQTSPRTIGAVQQSDILSEDPEATKDGLSLYLVVPALVLIN